MLFRSVSGWRGGRNVAAAGRPASDRGDTAATAHDVRTGPVGYNRRVRPLLFAVWAAIFATTVVGRAQTPDWQMPKDAKRLKSPVKVTPAIVDHGREVYKAQCAQCHGPQGKGDGPSADVHHPPADLSDLSRAQENPDGVLFYKIWNGRKSPAMPAFKSQLTKDEAWSVLEHIRTLRTILTAPARGEASPLH